MGLMSSRTDLAHILSAKVGVKPAIFYLLYLDQQLNSL